MRVLLVFVLLKVIILQTIIAQQENTDGAEKITFEEIIGLLNKNNPELKMQAYDIEALEKNKIQAGVYSNPEISFDAENILGSKSLTAFKGGEFTILVNQKVELGGKISERINNAGQIVNTRIIENKLKYLDMIRQLRTDYYNLYNINLKIELQKKFITTNNNILQTLEERVKAGKTSPAEISKVKIELINSELYYDKLIYDFKNISNQICLRVGIESKQIHPIISNYETIKIDITQNILEENLDEAPINELVDEIKKIRKTDLEIEKSNSIPDVNLSIGFRHLNEIGVNTFVAGFALPLPIFNTNENNIEAAEIKYKETDLLKEKMNNELLIEIEAYTTILQNSIKNITRIKNEILPESKRAYNTIKDGYTQGRFGFIDLLDAQRTLFETEANYLNELDEYYKTIISIENLTGTEYLN